MLFGHANPAVALSIYSHVLEQGDEGAANPLDQMIAEIRMRRSRGE